MVGILTRICDSAGVWQAAPNEVGQAVKAALKTGYRHIDDAWAYQVSVHVRVDDGKPA